MINFDRDLLFIRNLETDRNVALPLLRAVEQISGLQKVFLQAATSERDPKPFITRTPPVARRDLRGFSFGHTLPGSFIFTVSAPRLPSRTHAQLELKFTDEAEGQNLAQLVAIPFARRISERIARGLLFTKEADEKDYHVLLREYRSGFNANMCRAMVKMAGDGDSRVEFQIAWSPKLPAAKDVADMKAIEVDRDDCSTLEFVAAQLQETKPEPITIQGQVRGLLANDNPGLANSRRTVVVSGNSPTSNHRTSYPDC